MVGGGERVHSRPRALARHSNWFSQMSSASSSTEASTQLHAVRPSGLRKNAALSFAEAIDSSIPRPPGTKNVATPMSHPIAVATTSTTTVNSQ